jgi:hypothetical protein
VKPALERAPPIFQMMRGRLLFLLLLLTAFAFGAAKVVADEKGPPVEIELRNRRAEIRAELLKYTPLGASVDDVLRFLNKRLRAENGAKPRLENHSAIGPTAELSKNKGVQSIQLVLGEYLTNPALLLLDAPLPLETAVSVQWAFNHEGKLIEIFVDKQVAQP